MNVTATNILWEVYKTNFMTFFLILSLLPIQKGDVLNIFKMWIPRYIDLNPQFSQNILNKGIFQMWIHHYIDMKLHKSKHIKVVYL